MSFGPEVFVTYLSALEIRSIRGCQWEDLHYRVVNTEQDNELQFYCHHFEVMIVEAPSPSPDCGW